MLREFNFLRKLGKCACQFLDFDHSVIDDVQVRAALAMYTWSNVSPMDSSMR